MNHNAKFTFLYLLSLVSLGFTAISTGLIIFQIINRLLPDKDMLFSGLSQDAVKFGIAAIIVATPVLVWSMWQLNKNLLSGALDKGNAARRWLIYLILFAASITVLGWLIATLNVFLNGDLTGRFIAKFLTVLAIAGLVISYFFFDIKREKIVRGKSVLTWLSLGSGVLVLGAFVAAWFFIDSPSMARAKRYDDQVLQKIESINSAIGNYYAENKKLPNALNDLIGGSSYSSLVASDLKDSSGKAFEYKMVDASNYELCAELRSDNRNLLDDATKYNNERWLHGVGRTCWQRKTQGDLMPAIAPYIK